jgi:prepilin-type processing-associated H-X9-DG protein
MTDDSESGVSARPHWAHTVGSHLLLVLQAIAKWSAREAASVTAATCRQTARFAGYARGILRRRSLRRATGAAELSLGQRLCATGTGDSTLRSQIATLEETICTAQAAKQSTRSLEAEKGRLQRQLAALSLESAAEAPEAESEFKKVQEVRAALHEQEERTRAAAASLVPKDAASCLRVVVGYGTIALIGIVVLPWLLSARDSRRSAERINTWIEQLQSADAVRRTQAAQALGEMGAKAAVPALAEAADDADQQVREAALHALARIEPEGQPAQIASSKNNLRLLGAAMHRYHDKYGYFPPAAVYTADYRPLLSWRVLLLPYLGQESLAEQFDLDEPWDSLKNKPLLEKMPVVFTPVRGKTGEPHATYYQVFVGDRTMFGSLYDRGPSLSMFTIRGGVARTPLIVEAGEAVPWTKPDDVRYYPEKPLPRIGGLFPGICNACFADGHVETLGTTDENLLRSMITSSP